MKYCIGMDIGGSHISAALVDRQGFRLSEKSFHSVPVDPETTPSEFINLLEDCLLESAIHFDDHDAEEMLVGIAVPGPFDYENGVSEIQGVKKFDSLFGLDLRHTLYQRLEAIVGIQTVTIHFLNDAQAFLKGAVVSNGLNDNKVIGITLGTGIGAAFYENGQILTSGENIPPNGYIYNSPYLNGIAEDYISTHWLIQQMRNKGIDINNVWQISQLASKGDPISVEVFENYGRHLGAILAPFITSFGADTIVAGGGILKSFPLFEKSFRNSLKELGVEYPAFIICNDTRETAIQGAVAHASEKESLNNKSLRNTRQWLMPAYKTPGGQNSYDIYPTHTIASGKIKTGLGGLKKLLEENRNIVIDGYVAVDWDSFLTELTKALGNTRRNINFLCIDAALYDKDKIQALTAPYLDSDGKESIFGKLCPLDIRDFFDPHLLAQLQPEKECINILYGAGAAIAQWDAPVLYIDLPKNEIQFRSRAGWVPNLGRIEEKDAKKQYKRFYFVDWPVLNRHKNQLLPAIQVIIDGQRERDYTWLDGSDFRNTLAAISRQPFRARPWFEPGTWGGQWIKNNIEGLASDVPNYAWSFELISPENGLLLEDNGWLLECSFDWLMYAQSSAILGKAAARFGSYFPIRFDFLDTIDGDNLSIQVHPQLEYMKEHFGEPITQDETYYILDNKEDALVYLGFQDNVEPNVFEEALKRSASEKKAIRINKFVQALPSKKHELFLIPAGTIHGAGTNNLVLEISCTPYIYTFKLYDWIRMDLDGKPRPINIEHGMKNLDFSRCGNSVEQDLISHPVLLESGAQYEKWQLPTHSNHLYAIEKFIWKGELTINTDGRCMIGMLVEGVSVEISNENRQIRFAYAETFIIPAATTTVTLRYSETGKGIVLLSYIKDSYCS